VPGLTLATNAYLPARDGVGGLSGQRRFVPRASTAVNYKIAPPGTRYSSATQAILRCTPCGCNKFVPPGTRYSSATQAILRCTPCGCNKFNRRFAYRRTSAPIFLKPLAGCTKCIPTCSFCPLCQKMPLFYSLLARQRLLLTCAQRVVLIRIACMNAVFFHSFPPYLCALKKYYE
jgi:hypothetical protein